MFKTCQAIFKYGQFEQKYDRIIMLLKGGSR